MSITLWHTINLLKQNKCKAYKKLIPEDTNKPKIKNGGKEWNVEELKLKMKKAWELGKENEGYGHNWKWMKIKQQKQLLKKEIPDHTKTTQKNIYKLK